MQRIDLFDCWYVTCFFAGQPSHIVIGIPNQLISGFFLLSGFSQSIIGVFCHIRKSVGYCRGTSKHIVGINCYISFWISLFYLIATIIIFIRGRVEILIICWFILSDHSVADVKVGNGTIPFLISFSYTAGTILIFSFWQSQNRLEHRKLLLFIWCIPIIPAELPDRFTAVIIT